MERPAAQFEPGFKALMRRLEQALERSMLEERKRRRVRPSQNTTQNQQPRPSRTDAA